ncbi:MAG: HAD family phosphatase [Chloroflexota bacterium]|nr:HAD family phosphatase [Anaerolineae bacterium]
MADALPITTLFLDIGGVLLNNAWDRKIRQKASEDFKLDYAEMDERHHLTFDTYEEGKMDMDEYLNRVIFYEERSFSRDEFQKYMLAQSKPYPEMIAYIQALKAKYHLKIVVVSNECRELTQYRVKTFGLAKFVDFFIVSCFVHFRKPDPDIYRIALDVAQVQPQEVIYVEDRPMFVEVAQSLNLVGLRHIDLETTKGIFETFGLVLP